LTGEFVDVRITRVMTNSLRGEIVSSTAEKVASCA
jgi:TRAM domain